MITAGALKCFLGVGGEYFWLKRNMSISSLEGRTQEEQKEKKKHTMRLCVFRPNRKHTAVEFKRQEEDDGNTVVVFWR